MPIPDPRNPRSSPLTYRRATEKRLKFRSHVKTRGKRVCEKKNGLGGSPRLNTSTLGRNADTDRVADPEIRTVGPDGGIPLVELLEGDGELALDLGAAVAALDRIVLVAVGRFAGLGRRSWTTTTSAGRTTGGGSLDAVRVAESQKVSRSAIWGLQAFVMLRNRN